MAGAIDFGIIKPELAGSFGAGFRASQQERQDTEARQLKLDQLKQDREAMIQLQTQLKAAGKDPDLDKVFDALIASGNPDYVMKGMEGKQRLKEQREFAKLSGFEMPGVPAAPAAPMVPAATPVPNAMVAPGAPATPVPNAMMASGIPAAPAAPAPANALTAGQDQALVAQTQQRINKLLNFASTASPQMANNALAQARVLQDQLELYSKRGPNKPVALQELEAYMAMTPDQKTAFEKLQKIKSPGTTVSVNTPVAKSLAGPVGQRAEASLAKAEGAVGMMESANAVREALNTGNVIAGPLAGARTKFAQVLDLAGAGDKEKLVATRNAIQGLATLTLESRAELKGQGQVTENEQKLLERARSGNIEDMTITELQQVVNTSQRLANRLWSNHQTLLKTMETDPAAADSLRYYRPTGTLTQPIGEGKPKTETDKRRAGLDQIFGGKK